MFLKRKKDNPSWFQDIYFISNEANNIFSKKGIFVSILIDLF